MCKRDDRPIAYPAARVVSWLVLMKVPVEGPLRMEGPFPFFAHNVSSTSSCKVGRMEVGHLIRTEAEAWQPGA